MLIETIDHATLSKMASTGVFRKLDSLATYLKRIGIMRFDVDAIQHEADGDTIAPHSVSFGAGPRSPGDYADNASANWAYWQETWHQRTRRP